MTKQQLIKEIKTSIPTFKMGNIKVSNLDENYERFECYLNGQVCNLFPCGITVNIDGSEYKRYQNEQAKIEVLKIILEKLG